MRAILEAPSILGLKPTGVDRLPDALLGAGLAERIGARRAGRVEPAHAYDPTRAGEHAILNAAGIAAFSSRLADALGALLDRGDFPIVLGGDCSILLGSALALRRRGRYGLLFLDGHADFYQPEANPNGEAASVAGGMELALATGRGPAALTELEVLGPLVRDEDVVVIGWRDAEEQLRYGSQPLPGTIRAFDLAAVRRLGLQAVARDALRHLARDELEGFFVHLDAGVLDDAVMPAVDYRTPGGLSFDEVAALLRAARPTGRAVGIEITIFNPAMDPGGAIARAFADCLVDGLSR